MSYAARRLAIEPELEIHFQNDDILSASLGNVVFTVMWRSMNLESLHKVEAVNDRLLRLHPRGTATFNVVFPTSLLPESDARDAAARALEKHGSRHVCSATVVLGEGFWASAIRSALTTMFLMSRQRTPTKVFAKLDEASSWVADQVRPGGPSHADIAHVAHRLYSMRSAVR